MTASTTTPIANRYVFSAMATCLLMMASVLWIPAQLGAMAQGYAIDMRMLGLLASAEIFGFLAGTIAGSFIAVDRMKPWVLTGAACVVAANLALSLFAPRIPFIVMRPLASFGGGLAFAYALKICSKSAHPTRSFGIFTGLMSTMMILGFQEVGHMLAARAGADGVTSAIGAAQVSRVVFTMYACMAVLGALVLLGNQPKLAKDGRSRANVAAAALPPAVFVGLAAIALSFVGQGCIFSFLQTMGVAHGFPVDGVANAMSAWALFGILGSFSVGAMPEAMPRWVLIAMALLAMGFGYFALYAPSSSLPLYMVGCAIGGFYWNFILPLMLGLLARVDPSGFGSVWGGSMSSVGSMIGPVIAGLLISGANYTRVAGVSILLTIAGFLCVFWIERQRPAARP